MKSICENCQFGMCSNSGDDLEFTVKNKYDEKSKFTAEVGTFCMLSGFWLSDIVECTAYNPKKHEK